MKNWKKVLAAVLCLTCTPVPAMTLAQPETVEAAEVKQGVRKENGKYYYYENGKKLKNTWKTVTIPKKGGAKVIRCYYGKDGAAYKGKNQYGTNTPKIAKINGKTYGFGTDCHMLTGTYVADDKFYVFSKSGALDTAKTNALRKASAYEKSSADIRKLLGKPIKTEVMDGCYGDGKDYLLYYEKFILFLSKNNGKEVVLGMISR